MAGKQAKILSADHIGDLLFFAERSRHPDRNRLIVLLSVKAGLRAAEIAKLTWEWSSVPAARSALFSNFKRMRPRRVAAGLSRCTQSCGKHYWSCGSRPPDQGQSFVQNAVAP
jgi:hypothetical protein